MRSSSFPLPPLRQKVSLFLQIALFLCGGALLGVGYYTGVYNVILWGITCWFCWNLVYGLSQWRTRLIFLFFHVMIFTFLLSRPFIAACRGDVWWLFERETVYFALNVLWITLLCLRLGCMLSEALIFKKPRGCPHLIPEKRGYEVYRETEMMKNLRLVSLVFYLIASVFYWMIQIEKLAFIQERDYADIYLSFQSSLPGFFYTISSMADYAMCLFLATFPKKKWVYPVLILYVLGTVPDLIIGVRNPIVLAILFSFVYFLFRDILEGRSYWFGKVEKAAVILLLPAALIFLAFYNYIREGQSVDMGVLESIVDLFYKQGVSFDVLCRAYDVMPDLPDVVEKNYTFGPFIDYLTRGSFGQHLFGTASLGSQNSEELAIYGNSFAHSMSYLANPDYLSGHGLGSSYLLELFADWGYAGVVLGSTVFGAVMRRMGDGMRNGILLRTIVLTGLLQLFFVPRSDATGWLLFLVTFQFWLAIGFCFCVAGLLNKKYSFPTGRKKEDDYV